MADVAARLRVAREKAGLSIEELSGRTKIKPSILLAIELGAYEQLPGGEFFTRAFLRTYARELHLPVDEIMADYDSARPVPVVVQAPAQTSRAAALDDALSAWGWPVATAMVAGVVVLFAMTRSAPVAETELQPVATIGTSGPGASPTVEPITGSAPPQSLIIVIRPIRRLWVTGTADGKRVLYRVLEPGDEVTVTARETMTFRLGDAGAFGYALNGVPGKPPGRDGEVRDFVIDRTRPSQ